MRIEWTKDLELNHPKIDTQHRELFQRVNQLFEACVDGKGSHGVSQTINFLEKYVVEHFSCEEGLMKDTAYPGFYTHQSLHNAFVRSFAKLKEELGSQKPGVDMVVRVNHIVVEWLNQHIRSTDREFAIFLRNKGK